MEKIVINKTLPTQQEIDVEFPIFKKINSADPKGVAFIKTENEDFQSTIFFADDKRTVTIEVEPMDTYGSKEFVCGEDQFACTEEEFNTAVARAYDFLDRLYKEDYDTSKGKETIQASGAPEGGKSEGAAGRDGENEGSGAQETPQTSEETGKDSGKVS